MEEKVYFENSKGDKLCGILSDPAGDRGKPVIILCHGYTSSKNNRTILALGEILNKEGIPTFRFDFYGQGESGGKLEDLTVDELVDDVKRAHDFLLGNGYSKFGLFGSSFGGVAAPMAASEGDDFVLIALKAPGMGKSSRHNPLFSKDFEDGVWFEAAKKVNIPALVVHGGGDQDVEVELGMKLADSIKNCRLEIIEGADHGFTKAEDFDKMIKLVSEFVVEKSKG